VAQAKAYLIKGGLALNLQRAVNWVLFLKRKRKKRGRKLSMFYLFLFSVVFILHFIAVLII
jgi:uncharacterized membrane protein SpoIIM required for sporulation